MPDLQKQQAEQSGATSGKKQSSKKQVDNKSSHRVWRILGPLLGTLTAFGGFALSVVSIDNAALSAGLYGTPGTYRVDYCYDTTSSGGRNSHYVCQGEFTPHGAPADDSWAATLDDAGDFPDGTKLEVHNGGLDGESYRVAGLWPTLGEVWVAGCGLFLLGLGVSPLCWPKKGTRTGSGSVDSSNNPGCMFFGVAGLLITVLDGVVALVAWLVGLAT